MSKDLIRLMHALFLPAKEACQDAPWRPNMDVYRTPAGLTRPPRPPLPPAPVSPPSAHTALAPGEATRPLPLLPLKNPVLSPHLFLPLSVGRPHSIAAIEAVLGSE